MPKPGKLPDEPAEPLQPGRVVMAFKVGETEYRLHSGGWSWQDERDLGAATNGLQYPAIRAHMLGGNPSAYYLGCLIFLAEREQGKPTTFAEAQALSNYDDEFDYLDLKEEDDDSGNDPGSV